MSLFLRDQQTTSIKELEEDTVKVDSEERRVCDFDWLVGKPHIYGQGLLCKITRVVVRSGLIVGFHALVTAGKQQIEDKTPIYIHCGRAVHDRGLCSTTAQEEAWQS